MSFKRAGCVPLVPMRALELEGKSTAYSHLKVDKLFQKRPAPLVPFIKGKNKNKNCRAPFNFCVIDQARRAAST